MMARYLVFLAVFVMGLAAGAAIVLPTIKKQFARGLDQGRQEIRLEAIKAEAATMKNGRFVWMPAR